jgi:tripartite-type tricarboxylate transporter receptor subunit TctC
MKVARLIALVFFIAVIVGVITETALSSDYPNKPLRIIINYSAGGGHDTMARAFQKPLSEALGVSVLVENKPGGSTKIGTSVVLKAKPDGYTVTMQADRGWVGYFYSKTYDYKPWETLTPVANIVEAPYGFIQTRVGSGYDTWDKLVAAANKNPGKLSCSGPAAGGVVGLIFSEITKRSGIEARYVPFKGASPAMTALLGGHVDFQITTVGEAVRMMRANKTHGLAISSDGRYPQVPDVPTFNDLGIGEPMLNTFSFWGPPKMDKKIVTTLAAAIEKAVQDPEFKDFIENKLTNKIVFKTADQVVAGTQSFEKKWGDSLAAQYK